MLYPGGAIAYGRRWTVGRPLDSYPHPGGDALTSPTKGARRGSGTLGLVHRACDETHPPRLVQPVSVFLVVMKFRGIMEASVLLRNLPVFFFWSEELAPSRSQIILRN